MYMRDGDRVISDGLFEDLLRMTCVTIDDDGDDGDLFACLLACLHAVKPR